MLHLPGRLFRPHPDPDIAGKAGSTRTTNLVIPTVFQAVSSSRVPPHTKLPPSSRTIRMLSSEVVPATPPSSSGSIRTTVKWML